MARILKYCCILPFFLLLQHLVVAQNERIEDLLTLLPEISSDTAIINIWNELSYEYYRIDINKTIYYSELALDRAEEIGFQRGIARALNCRAIAYSVQYDHEQTILLNNKSLEIARQLNDPSLMGNALNDLGITYGLLNLPKQALEYYLEAEQYLKQVNSPIVIFTLDNLSFLYNDLGDEEKATYYNQEVRLLAATSTYAKVQYYEPLYQAFDAWELAQYDSAQYYLEVALATTTTLIDKASVIRNLSMLAAEQENYNQAKKYSLESLKMVEQSGNKDLLIFNVINHAEILLQTAEYQECLSWLSIYISDDEKQTNYPLADLAYAHSLEAEAFRALGQSERANECLLQQIHLKDSINQTAQRDIVSSLEAKYQIQKQKQENIALRELQTKNRVIAQERQKVSVAMFIALLLALAVIGLLIWVQLRNKRFNKTLKAEVKTKTQKLQTANQELQASNTELERFAYITSHDLREPLRNISGFSTLITRQLKLKEQDQQSIQEYLHFIKDNTLLMDQLIKDILEYSRLEVVRQLPFKKIAVAGIIEEISQSISLTLKERLVSLEYEDLPHIYTAPQQLLLVFQNLITNGIKYNKSKQPVIKISYQLLVGFHQFSVADNGIGIASEFKNQIFDLFKRLHNRQEYEGTGVGLASSKKIVTKLGGNIWLEDSEMGSVFSFTLPINDPEVSAQSSRLKNAAVI